MAIRRRKNRYCVELRPKNRTPSYKTFDNLLDAQRFEAEQKILLKRGDIQSIIKRTLAQTIERYEAECSIHKKSQRSERYRLQQLREDLLADAVVSQITKEDVEDWIERRRKTGVKEPTILRDLMVLSAVLTQAVKWRYCHRNPIRRLCNQPKNSPGRWRRIKRDEVQALLKALDYQGQMPIETLKQGIAVAFLLAMETGMRQGELFALRWENVHWEENYVHVLDSKNGDARMVPLTEQAVALLRQMQGSGLSEVRVFPWRQSYAGNVFAQAVKACGIHDLHFHDSRHEACSVIARLEGMTPMLLLRIMGWRDIKTALIYFNPSAEDLVRARRRPPKD